MSVCVVYRELLEEGKHILAQAEIVDAECDAWLLLEHVSGMNRAQFFLHQQDTVPDELEADYRGMLRKRAEHIPLQHLTGTQEFMGLEFQVSPDVLIPRQDTELLVEKLLPHIQGKRVLDVCTGSGCIIISILHNVEGVKGYAVDISKQAVNVAKENAKLNEVPVLFERSDLFEMVTEKFDVIVSNPPYYVDSLLSPDEGRNTARHAAGLPFGELAAAVVRLLAPGGRFALVLPPVEMQRFRSAALGRLYPVRWTEVYSTPRRGVRRILAEFCTTPVPPPEPSRLVIELGGSDSYTEDYRRLTGDFYLKF